MNTDEVIARPPYSAKAEVELLINRLRIVEVGATITYQELDESVHESVQSPRGRNILSRARRLLIAEESIVFETLSKVGLRRCNDPGKLAITKNGVKSIQRKARATKRTLDTIDYLQLETALKLSYLANSVALSLIGQYSSDKFLKTLVKNGLPNLGKAEKNLLAMFTTNQTR